MSILKRFPVFVLAFFLIFGFSTMMVVEVFSCTQGCTPGFWKNPKHFVYWVGYSPTDNVGDIFDPGDEWASDYDFLKSQTLLEALQMRGGKGWMFTEQQKAARILLRQAVAALLNGAYFGWPGYYPPAQVIDMVMGVLKYTSPSAIEGIKNHFQNYNELGSSLCE